MKKQYEFAGVGLEIEMEDGCAYEDERAMKAFAKENLENPHRFKMETVEKLDEPLGNLVVDEPGLKVYSYENLHMRYIGTAGRNWEHGYIRAVHQGRNHYVQVKASECKGKIGIKTVLNSIGAEHLVLEENGAILHASFIEHDGKAILFTAPSETGKSTQADLWKTLRNAQIVNGDRAVIRVVGGEVYASGIPFAGSSTYCENRTITLAAIVYLGQAPVTEIQRLGAGEAFRRIWEGCTVNNWNQEDVKRATDIVGEIASKVPVYYLKCTPDESAVIALESQLESR